MKRAQTLKYFFILAPVPVIAQAKAAESSVQVQSPQNEIVVHPDDDKSFKTRQLRHCYQMRLAGISVGGAPLDIPPAVFSEGVITDSGTIVSVLQEMAYVALRTAFRSAMAGYPLAPPVGHLDTCYNLTGYDSVTVPTVSLTFKGGATVDLDASSGVLLDGCLAFWGSNGDNYTGIIGNVNQRTIEVLYDIPGGKVGFRTGAC
ncbi:hypothetical protein ACP4OV_001359 [Aristida adscensionis]